MRYFVRACTSAPASTSASTVAALFAAAAHISAVCPFQFSAALTSAPWTMQRFHGCDVAGAGRRHERGVAFRHLRVGVGARLQQPLHHRRAAVDAGEPQRRCAVSVGGPYVRARLDQQIGSRKIVEMRGPVKRRRPVDFSDCWRRPVAPATRGRCRPSRLSPPRHERRLTAGGDAERGSNDDGPRTTDRLLDHYRSPTTYPGRSGRCCRRACRP